jgi:hypothetical protein
MTELHVNAIDPRRLDAIRGAGKDEHGNDFVERPAEGWEPLRCCLRTARPGEAIALVSYSPFTAQSPWAEVGPVFVHADTCEGYHAHGELPGELRVGPRVLRTYYADESLDYDDITFVAEGQDLEPVLRDLLDRPQVAAVHVRAAMSQCFTYEVRREPLR